MAIAERRSTVKRFLNIRGPSENACLATVACALLLLNIVAGLMVNRALPSEPRASTEKVFVLYGD